MTRPDQAQATSQLASDTAHMYCPECGQPFARSEPHRREPGAARSMFLIAIGLYLSFVFGLDAWRAERRIQDASGCPSAERRQDCVALSRDLSLQIASRNLATGEAFAARISEVQLGRDARYAAVGVTGLVVGLGALLLRAHQARRSTRFFGIDVWLAAEGVLVVLYAQLIALVAYQLVKDAPVGAAIALDRVDGSLYRALASLFALVGVL